MADHFGKTVRLFLVDGSPTGLITAEIINWSGHVLIVPRHKLAEALQRGELNRTGIYLLVGDDPPPQTKRTIYIGEADNIADRIKNHVNDESKDFWTRACVFTSKDLNLTKAHARYLESRLIEIATLSQRAELSNSTQPAPKLLPESDVADMEFFLQQIQLILPVVGLDILRPAAAKSTTSGMSQPLGLELFLFSPKYQLEARGMEVDGEIVVLRGSRALAKGDFAQNSYAQMREQLVKDGRLKADIKDPSFLVFVDDVSFPSPSAAASVISNRNTNGRLAWKIRSNSQTLKEWEEAQIKQVGFADQFE